MTDLTNGMQALAEYGYIMSDDGVMRNPLRIGGQMWKPVDGGFLRFDKNGGMEVPMPWKVSEAFRKVSGLDFREQPQCFDWIWPEPEIAKIYVAAKIAQDERAREKAGARVVLDEPISREKVEAMIEAQQPAPAGPDEAEPEAPKKKGWFR